MSKLFSSAVLFLLFAATMIVAGCGGSPNSRLISVITSSAASALDPDQTVSVNALVTHDPSAKGVVWSLTGPGTLSNSTGSSVIYNAPTGVLLTSAEQATVTATSVADPSKQASLSITVNPTLQISRTRMLANGSVGSAYSQQIPFSGGTSPFQWSIFTGPAAGGTIGGSLPDGLKLDAATGIVSGTPIGAGTWYFAAAVTDAAGVSDFNGWLSIQVNPTAPPGNPVPRLNQPLAPAAVSPGSAAFTLDVTGTGFVSGATIDFNNSPLATAFQDSGHLSATVPAADVVKAGTASVTVINPTPGGGRSNVVYFQVQVPQATVNFATAPNSLLQFVNTFGIVAGDFNEDGKPDLIITGSQSVHVFLGAGDGTFTSATGSPISVKSPPFGNGPSPYTGPTAVGDFNKSGHLGLAVGMPQNQAAAIFFGKGDGTFVSSSAGFARALGLSISAVEAADFNADGNVDLAILSSSSGQSPLLLGYGTGAFTGVGSLIANLLFFPSSEAVGDFNGDGKLDVALAGFGSTTYPYSGVAVSLGNGDGTFSQANGSPISLGTSLSAVLVADFDGDGKLDVAVTDYGANAVMILRGNGNGTFAAPITVPVGSQPDAIAVGDFNDDGKLDLAIANYVDGTVTLLLGNGDGTFAPASSSPYAVGGNPYNIVAADFNGDGKLDLATTNGTDGSISILLQQ